MPSRIVALVSEPVSSAALKRVVGKEFAADADVFVVAPSLNSRTRWVLADPDPAIERAEGVAAQTVDALGEAGIDATGEAGEEDPLLALQDAIARVAPDRVVLFTHAEGERNWLEEGVVEAARERFDQPVEHYEVPVR